MASAHRSDSCKEVESVVIVVARENKPTASPERTALCAFCQKLPAVCKVERLRIRGDGVDDFVKVHLPYCGMC